MKITCGYCGKEFETNDRRRKYCGRSCSTSMNNKVRTKVPQTIICRYCGAKFTAKHSEKRVFCSISCSNRYRAKNKVWTEEERKRVSKKVLESYEALGRRRKQEDGTYLLVCKKCGKEFKWRRRRVCDSCISKVRKRAGKKAGKVSAAKRVKRSKAEIKLFELLSRDYKCKHNEPLFNGWDADIIIPSLTLAILWNGPWHYTKITKKHSLKQVKNRDRIKLSEIKRLNWSYLIIQDFKNNMTPEKAFLEIQDCIKNQDYNREIV